MARSPIRTPSDVTRDPRPRRSRTVKEVRHRGSIVSRPQSTVDAPNMDELRRMRADFYSGSPRQRRRSITEEIVREEPRRIDRVSRVSMDIDVKRPRITVRETNSSDRRQRREKPREADGGSRVYGYRNEEREEELPQHRQSRRQTVSSSVASHQADRPRERYAPRREPSRREPQRRRSDDRDSEVVVVRTEKRFAPPASRAQHRDPLQRYSKHKTWGPYVSRLTRVFRSSSMRKPSAASTVPPPLTRSQTTARRTRLLTHGTPPTSSACEKLERSPTNRRKSENGSVFFGSIFGPPKPLKPERQYV